MSFVSTDPVSHSGKSDIWLTPLALLERIGTFDLDPCGHYGHQTAKEIICPPDNGLNYEWNGKVWLNPPYSSAEKWVDKLSSYGLGCALIFVRTGSKWIQRNLPLADSVCFIKGRISFMRSDGTYGHNAGADSMLLCYGMEVRDKTLGVFMTPTKPQGDL